MYPGNEIKRKEPKETAELMANSLTHLDSGLSIEDQAYVIKTMASIVASHHANIAQNRKEEFELADTNCKVFMKSVADFKF